MSIAFTPDDLGQIKTLAEHIDLHAPVVHPAGTDARLPLEVLIRDGFGEVAVRIEVNPTGEPSITFPEEKTP